ncbi:MAG: DUF1868 domain-containing protein [Elainellaceae cyanobacterium]
MDDLYMDYINRVARMTLTESYSKQLRYAQPSAKYRQSDNGAKAALPFPGYSVITPPQPEDWPNKDTHAALEALQGQLNEKLPDVLGLVPASSLHLTVADLIWDDAYRMAAQSPSFHNRLRQAIASSFQSFQSQTDASSASCTWQILGLMVMPRAIGVSLAPKTEGAYQKVLNLRRAVYQNRQVIALGIEQQYHLTAHITLGYFTAQINNAARSDLLHSITALNDAWQAGSKPHLFQVHQVELRKFEDMSAFEREPDWPVVSLGCSSATG